MATKSDAYTHVMDIPPQYGPGFSIDEAKPFADRIMGRDGSWSLPLRFDCSDDLAIEPLSPLINRGEEAARHEAASKLIGNLGNVVRFAARGSGKPGRPQFQAPLADPYATPDEARLSELDVLLRHVAHALVDGADAAADGLKRDADALRDNAKARDAPPLPMTVHSCLKELVKCLEYLRDRVGVPRDMSEPAALALRAHLNWVMTAI